MTSSIEETKEKEKKDTIEGLPKNQKEADETQIITTTNERKSTTEVLESSTKKRESSTTAERQKGDGDTEEDEKDNGKNTDEATVEQNSQKKDSNDVSSGPVVSVTKRTRPPYKYDPEKVTLRFLFANRDGLTVTVECKPSDTVGEVKGQLLSVWPEGMSSTSSESYLIIRAN